MHSFRHLFFGTGVSFPESLCPQRRAEGRRIFYRFYVLNGISVACLMNNMLILYGFRNGMSDPAVAIMASFVHLTMPFMLIGKHAIARCGAARTRALGWFFRYVFAFLMVFAPFIGRLYPPSLASGLIFLGAFGFAAFRSIGVAAINPLQGEVVESNARGKMVSTILLCVQSTYFITLVMILLAFRATDALWLYQTVLGVGCVVGLYASTLIAKVPESSAPQLSARKPFRDMVRVGFATRSYRRLIAAWCAGLAAKALVLPFLIISLKGGYQIADFQVVLYTLVMALGTIASGYFSRIVSDRYGARAMLVFYTLVLIGISGFWAFAPPVFLPVVMGGVFFLAGFAEVGIDIGLNHHFLEIIPKEDRVGNSLLMRITSGATAGLSAFILGAGLLRALPKFGFAGLDIYRHYFLVILVLLLILIFYIRGVEDHNTNAGETFASPRG